MEKIEVNQYQLRRYSKLICECLDFAELLKDDDELKGYITDVASHLGEDLAKRLQTKNG